MDIIKQLILEFKIQQDIAQSIITLIDDGNTIPFISRYRKELTGSASDEFLRDFSERLIYLRNLEKRKAEVLSSIEEQGKLTEEISLALESAKILAEVEDIYRPFKQKRRTRASIAKERGLEPLAQIILQQQVTEGEPLRLAANYINPELGVETAEAALQGACDIIAEIMADEPDIRKKLKELIWRAGTVVSRAKTEEDSVYAMYYEFSEKVSTIANHRILALNRGEREDILKVDLSCDREKLVAEISRHFFINPCIFTLIIRETAQDAFDRLIFPSIEREIRTALTDSANTQAIKMFGQNLKATLMGAPVRGKNILAIDPGYRTGCKVAVIDDTGKVMDHDVIYPTPPRSEIARSGEIIKRLVKKNGVTAIAVGNGTASKETEIFVSDLIPAMPGTGYAIVNEAGASVYSASKLGTEEFPDLDVTIRGAISLARRLLDPLSELVKIDPKSIGVGLYQHDMPPAQLDLSLVGVVEECVNSVGVDVNTASPALLKSVAGVGAALAKNIAAYREEIGKFTSRKQLLKVPKLGPKAYTQCAGFLRIPGGDVLDNTSVHPESYKAVEALLKALSYTKKDITQAGLADIDERLEGMDIGALAESCGIGVPTLRDIIAELKKPGRDMRDDLPPTELRSDLLSLENLKPDMELSGVVRNVIDFGAFIDIGVHQDGLVHISEICDRYIKHPSEVLKSGDRVKVKVLGIDKKKNRISLTMKF